MSGKSIYVMDTPKACNECPLSLETEAIDTIICRGCEKYSINNKCTEKPAWCPLKKLPEEIEMARLTHKSKNEAEQALNRMTSENSTGVDAKLEK